jgi:hypothetical protein
LKQIESSAFSDFSSESIVIPVQTSFNASDAFSANCAVCRSDDEVRRRRKGISSLRRAELRRDLEHKEELQPAARKVSAYGLDLSII